MKMLTEDTARSIGMSSYFPHVRRVFVDILRALDANYGRPLMMTNTQNLNKVSVLHIFCFSLHAVALQRDISILFHFKFLIC